MKGINIIGANNPELSGLTTSCEFLHNFVSLPASNIPVNPDYSQQTQLVYTQEHLRSHRKKSSYDELIRSICLNRLELTSRETDCYCLLVKGYRSKEIGKELGISYRTVEKHIENIKEKLECNTLPCVISLISRCLFEALS